MNRVTKKYWYCWICVFWWWLCMCPVEAEPASSDDLDAPVPMWDMTLPEADQLQRAVIAALPDVPMQIQAVIRSKQHGGRVERVVNAEVELNSEAGAYSATYTILDRLGGEREQLIVNRQPELAPEYRYRVGEPLHDAQAPGLYDKVQGTDLTWVDLCLSYLWWPGGETVGTDRVRGRFCYVVDLPAPEDLAGEFDHVRIWVDPKINMLLKAEAYDSTGERIRKMGVESFKKVDGVWFIKDIDVYSYPSKDRTSLRVHHVRRIAADEELEPITAPTAD